MLCCDGFAEFCEISVIDLSNELESFDNKHLGTGVWNLRSSLKWPWGMGFDLNLSMCLISIISHG